MMMLSSTAIITLVFVLAGLTAMCIVLGRYVVQLQTQVQQMDERLDAHRKALVNAHASLDMLRYRVDTVRTEMELTTGLSGMDKGWRKQHPQEWDKIEQRARERWERELR